MENEKERSEAASRGMTPSLHVQTLVDMNHCVSTARRDAAFKCVVDFVTSSSESLREESVTKRLEAYSHCAGLLEEARLATNRSTMSYERKGLFDRPVVHILNLLSAMVSTIMSLASHVQMVQMEAEILCDPLGQDTYSLLVNTCRDFEANERVARGSFAQMLNVGRMLVESSTAKQKEYFTEDDMRRYDIAYNEYVRHYAEEGCLDCAHIGCGSGHIGGAHAHERHA